MRIAPLIILAATFCAITLAASHPVLAKRPPCSRDEMAISDVRGGKICLKKSEWQTARKICAKNGSSEPMGCICQDADSVGACGD